MSSSNLTPYYVAPRKPLDSQRNAGGDMSMMFLAYPAPPRKFPHQNDYLVKGLNTETLARVVFPPPPWLTTPEYSFLCINQEPHASAFFSLNLPIYNQGMFSSDWEAEWFLMYGRVHPFALTWEIEPDGELPQDYTIPALIVRDQSCQP